MLEQVENTPNSPVFLIPSVIAAVPLCHWDLPYHTRNIVHTAPKLMTSIMHKHVNSEGAALSPVLLHALVDSSAHYLVGLFPRQDLGESQSMLPILLAQMFAKSDRTETLLNRTIAVILAAAAFATHPYPGGEHSLQDLDSCERRALQVLQHYRDNEPGQYLLLALFNFGFVGLMHRLDFALLGKDAAAMDVIATISEKLRGYTLLFNSQRFHTNIHGLPPSFTLETHVTQTVSRCLLSVAHGSFSHSGEETMVSSCLAFLLPESVVQVEDTRLYFAALVALCHAQSDELQDFCFRILDVQPLPMCSSELIQEIIKQSLPERLYQLSGSNNQRVVSVATLHFGLLVASIASFTELSLGDRQIALKPLVELEDFAELKPSTIDRSPPSVDEIYAHLERSFNAANAPEANHHVMQLVVNFCHAEQRGDQPIPQSSTDANGQSWHKKLQELKNSYRSSLLSNLPPSAASVSGPLEPNQEPERTQAEVISSIEYAWLPGLCVCQEAV
jgi:hypothetical protein